ncbi:MAG: phosphopentomutase, partial [Clostridia bacterium]|nr:phosphopentomutase [Clostridia bacterium]
LLDKDFNGLCFINFVDFDSVYGHRNDANGYAKEISNFDNFLGEFIENLKSEDMLIITADHGCDPSTPSTDHSREDVPCLIYKKGVKSQNLGTKNGFNFISKVILKEFNL